MGSDFSDDSCVKAAKKLRLTLQGLVGKLCDGSLSIGMHDTVRAEGHHKRC